MARRTELEARVTRSMVQDMRVVGANLNTRTNAWTIRIKGSTGDRVYRVVFKTDSNACTCPDFFSRGGDHCKHIFFIINRVVEDRVLAARMIDSPKHTPIYQLEPRLPELFHSIFFEGIPRQTTDLESETETETAATHGHDEAEAEEDPEEVCAICLELIVSPAERENAHTHGNGNGSTRHRKWTCGQCKHRLHKRCFESWYFHAPGPGLPKCPLCRVPIKPRERMHVFFGSRGRSHAQGFSIGGGIASALGIGVTHRTNPHPR